LKSNLSLRVEDTDSADTFTVSGRGELHLAILIETMRREGYEFHVARPEVILKKDAEGSTLEPFEEAHIECSQGTSGAVIEMMGKRRGEMLTMQETGSGTVQMTFIVPTRGMLGFRQQFLTVTKGTGVLNTIFHGYQPMAGPISTRARGSLIAYEDGVASTYGLKAAEERGTLFISAGTQVYAGMVVGEQPRDLDMEVNVVKTKKLTSMRETSKGEIEQRLSPPRIMSLDEAIEQLAEDELLEVTPKSLRLRKRILDMNLRYREAKKQKEAIGEG
jgi:GTP-binding protein